MALHGIKNAVEFMISYVLYKTLCVGGGCLCFFKDSFLFHFLFIQSLWADEFRKMGLSVLDEINATGLKPRETFPLLQLLKSCDGAEEGPL